MNRALVTRAALIVLTSAGLTSPVSAATVTVNQTLDLALTAFAPTGWSGVSGAPAFSAPFSVPIAVGDTFDFTIDFASTQTLTLTNTSLLWAFSFADTPSSRVTGTGSLSLLDASGNAFLSSNVKTSTEGLIHFGQQFGNGDFAGALSGSVTFYGLRYTATLDSYDAPGLTVRNYNLPALYFSAESNSVALVPEPETYALMLAGLGLVGLVARRSAAAKQASMGKSSNI